MTAIIDSDMHLYEPRDMWAEHVPATRREHALRISDDELGHAWLMLGDRRVHLAEVHHPGDVSRMGAYRRLVRAGLPAPSGYDEALPPAFWDPAVRREQLDGFGLAGTVLFPNYGLIWERSLRDDLEATRLNLSAWNRWAVEVAAEGRGRLHPVGHVTLRDVDWLHAELHSLSAGGVRLAMVAPALVEGRRLSHPGLDPAWSAFEQHGVSPVFHVAAFPARPFDDAWYENDPDQVTPVLSSSFLSTAPALAVADMAVNGAFQRHPELRLGIMELTAQWVPLFLRHLDGAFAFHAAFEGRPLCDLPMRPSEYIARQVRVAAFPDEQPARLIDEAGDLFMFCSDYPHAEGSVRPVEDYAEAGSAVRGRSRDLLYGGNIRWLLHDES